MFRGAITALVTPFREGRVDEPALRALVERQVEGGIDGLVPCGTTGEASTLTVAEQMEVVRIVVDAAAGRVPVIAGAGANDTREALELVERCQALGASATLQVVPYYNRPSEAGIVAHMRAIADLGLPVILYNIPSRTGVDLSAAGVAELAEHPRIVGVKEATGDMIRAREILESCGPDFALLSGDDHTVLPLLAMGGHGVVSVVSNVLPSVIRELCEAMWRGELDRARELDRRHIGLTRALFAEPNPAPTKLALSLLGHMQPDVRSPLLPVHPTSEAFARVRAQLRNLELLP